jgi:hypothetical protein
MGSAARADAEGDAFPQAKIRGERWEEREVVFDGADDVYVDVERHMAAALARD